MLRRYDSGNTGRHRGASNLPGTTGSEPIIKGQVLAWNKVSPTATLAPSCPGDGPSDYHRPPSSWATRGAIQASPPSLDSG